MKIQDAQWADCPEHGRIDHVDEDGCCLTCGADSIIYGTLIEAPAEKVRRLMEAVKEWYEADYPYRHAGPDTNLNLDWIDRMDDAEDTLSLAYAALQDRER